MKMMIPVWLVLFACNSVTSQVDSNEDKMGIKQYRLGTTITSHDLWQVFDTLKYKYTVRETGSKVYESKCYDAQVEVLNKEFCFEKIVSNSKETGYEINRHYKPKKPDETSLIVANADLADVGGHFWRFISFRTFENVISGISIFIYSYEIDNIISEKYGMDFEEYDGGKAKIWHFGSHKIATTEYEDYMGEQGTLLVYSDTIIENKAREFRIGRKEGFD